ncbi:MAG: glycosyltransferase [Kiritimatiellae bacterium]|nr:glycosyltransferase [Kiritimatiellia bacterium]
MKVQMLWYYYPAYLEYFWARHPECLSLEYREQRDVLLDDHFAWPGDMSRYLQRQGMEVDFVVRNDERLQKKWAREVGFDGYPASEWQRAIAEEQVRRFRPDFLWISFGADFCGEFVRAVHPWIGKAGLWMGSPFRPQVDTDGVAVLLTENPLTLRDQQARFEKVIVTTPGFDPAILDRIGHVEKTYDVTFVGQVSPLHRRRAEILAHLLANGINVHLRGFVTGGLLPTRRESLGAMLRCAQRGQMRVAAGHLSRLLVSRSYNNHLSQIRKVLQPPVFGLDMYRELARSRVVLNTHIDVASGHAGNMRMFEATGVGACLLTDAARNVESLFVPGREVLVYRSKNDLLEQVRAALADPAATARVALAGKRRTLRDHNLASMFERIRLVFDSK